MSFARLYDALDSCRRKKNLGMLSRPMLVRYTAKFGKLRGEVDDTRLDIALRDLAHVRSPTGSSPGG